MMWRAGCLAGVLLVATHARAAPAPPPPMARLVLTAPPELACLSDAALPAAVVAKVGRDPFAPDAPVLRVAVAVDGDHAVARIEKGASAREVELPSLDCSEMLATLALSIAIAVDPLAMLGAPPPPPPVDEPPPPPPPPPPARWIAEDRSPRWRLGGQVGSAATLGATPGASASVELGAAFVLPRWRIELTAHLGALGGEREVSPGTVGASTSWLSARLCMSRVVGPFFACGTGGAGFLWGRGEGFVINAAERSTVALAGVRVGASLTKVGPFALAPFVAVDATLVRTSLRVDRQVVWRAPAVQGSAGLALIY